MRALLWLVALTVLFPVMCIAGLAGAVAGLVYTITLSGVDAAQRFLGGCDVQDRG